MVCVEVARFILVRAERPYIQLLMACVAGTIDDQTHSRGYKQLREEVEALISLIGVEVKLRSYKVES
jgi:hypothetical protein